MHCYYCIKKSLLLSNQQWPTQMEEVLKLTTVTYQHISWFLTKMLPKMKCMKKNPDMSVKLAYNVSVY